MPVTVITPSSVEPVSTAEAKAFSRVDASDDDSLIASLIVAAREYVEQATGRQLVEATLRLTLRDWPRDMIVRLPRSPTQSVSSVKYRNTDGDLVTLEADADYLVDTAAEPATVEPLRCWPRVGDYPDAVQITFIAGYPASDSSPPDHAANVPSRAKVAIKALAAHWYESREPVAYGNVRDVPFHLGRLINSLRIWGQP